MITNVLEYLERSAERFPDKIVFGDTSRKLTYREFMDLAKRAGSCLAAFHLKNQPIAVITTHSVECLIAFFGVVYSGNFYVPLDSKQPRARMQAILDVARPGIVIVPDKESFGELSEKAELISREELQESQIDAENLEKIREEHLDVYPLYLMFTSGSTGVPKGVLINHRSVVDLVEQFAQSFGFDEKEVFANQAPFDFDVSVKDIYNTLRNGASMYIVPQSMFIMPKKLVPYLKENKVTVCIWAVSALSILATVKALDKEVPENLKKIMFSGEVMPVKVLNYWREHLPKAMYVNLYGPTEITCNCTYHILNREYSLQEAIPIGKAFKNTQIFLLDENGKEVPFGEAGEICVKGTCLALGYYRNKEATEAAFRQNPLNPDYPDLLYHTGDYGRYNEEGFLVFAARRDWQIKHMGHRIELSEIESAVNSLAWIDSCCCQYDEEKGKIVLIYQAEEPCEGQIMDGLKELLPKYMCPNRFVFVPRMAMNQRGKIDRVFIKKKYVAKLKAEEDEILYKEAVVLGTGGLALQCAEALVQAQVFTRIYDTGEQPSKTLERQALRKNISYQWIPGTELAALLDGIRTATLVVSAISPWIIPRHVLENPYLLAVNCHQALLPAHPGRNAEMWSVYEEDEKTGITWHIMSPQVDAGEIVIQKEMPISGKDTALTVFRRQSSLAEEAFEEILGSLLKGNAKCQAQQGEKSRLRYSWEVPEEGCLNLSWPFHKISAFLRALDYGPLSVVRKPFAVKDGKKVYWKSYQIEENSTDEDESSFNCDHIVIRCPEGRITLKNIYVEDEKHERRTDEHFK